MLYQYTGQVPFGCRGWGWWWMYNQANQNVQSVQNTANQNEELLKRLEALEREILEIKRKLISNGQQ